MVGPLPKTKHGYKYLLTCMVISTRYPEEVLLKRVDVITVTDTMLTIFARFGILEEILTDNGGVFTGKLADELMRMLRGEDKNHCLPPSE